MNEKHIDANRGKAAQIIQIAIKQKITTNNNSDKIKFSPREM